MLHIGSDWIFCEGIQKQVIANIVLITQTDEPTDLYVNSMVKTTIQVLLKNCPTLSCYFGESQVIIRQMLTNSAHSQNG